MEADQSKKADAGKPLLFSVPTELVQAVGQVMTFGAQKYGRDTWRGVETDLYQQALARHFEEYKADAHAGTPKAACPTCGMWRATWRICAPSTGVRGENEQS